MTLIDSFRRRVTYLRVSLTDRCNYRCAYCMPADGVALRPRAELLSFEEIERVVRCFARMGVRRVRLTGGEPTVRRDVVELARRLAALPGIDELCLTTNGHLLAELARPLREAGVRSLNVSLDSLRADRFRAITRRGDLDAVLAGIEAARAAGFPSLKLNAVGLRGINEDELADLCRFAWQREIVPRFIEWMPMGEGEAFSPGAFLSAREMRARIEADLGGRLEPIVGAGGGIAGPARTWRHAPSGRDAGFIAALTENFCETCNRVRLTSAGEIHTCLARDEAVSLRDLLRAGATDDALEEAILASVIGKQSGHAFTTLGCGGPRTQMVAIGG
ncbi:MAG: GTP 3',8-cyclase MoaA [Myxococcota bacterium]